MPGATSTGVPVRGSKSMSKLRDMPVRPLRSSGQMHRSCEGSHALEGTTMAVSMTTQNTVLGVLIPREGTVHLAANVATVVIGSILLTIAAKISVPVWPVPVTLQSFAVAALAAAFGWRIGV